MSEAELVEDNVDRIRLGSREIYLVGTAHISQSSADLAEKIIREIAPHSVAVELCASRHSSLLDPDRWKNTDIVSVVRSGRAYLLMAQLVLAGFQKKLGDQLNIKPGAEMMRALEVADDVDAEMVLADRDVRTTLKRTWASLGFWGGFKLVISMIGSLFSSQKIDEEEIERLKKSDALEEMMREFSDALPGVREALIDERDQYLAQKIKEAPGEKVVAIIGAGHVPGIKRWIHEEIDLSKLNEIPPPRKLTKMIAWIIPLLVLALFAYGFTSAGLEKSLEMAQVWFWINGSLGALGSLLALGHPLTILTAFIVSPFTSLNPFIAGGWVAGLVEAIVRKPRVSDLEALTNDVATLKGIWTNRVSRILLVIALTNLLGTIGTLVGIERMSSLL